ncbi:MAG TPA: DUF1552 domain-containing protein [Verrucomicrobiae bacterium]|nr:DUF1552 domain-containing protein [Verrucomicrobiae bacterium]
MTKSWQLPRRTFLKGLGTAIALPLLDSMAPARLLAATAAPATAFPRRMAFVYLPNGMNMADWTPAAEGAGFELPYILEPLKAHKDEMLILTGLTHDKARPNGDGPGDHARASATFLTGCQARKTQGADIKVGVSVDQVAAAKLGNYTRFASLELGCDRGQTSGNCDSGYSCAYSYNIAWRNDHTPLPPETDPRQVFERLFANNSLAETKEARAKRKLYNQSILDFVQDDAKRLQSNLGATDRRKMDEYLTAVREMEQRIEKAEKFVAALPNYDRPSGIPTDYAQHIRLMYDLLALAWQTDSTRIASFVPAHDGSNRPSPFIGVSEGHHDLSHHGNDAAKKEKIAKINHFHTTQFAYFIEKLKSIKEGEGTLLDNSMVVYGSGIGDGDHHNHDNLPVMMFGKGGGTIQTGRHVRYARNTPMSNLFLSMLDKVGTPVERLGDSTGTLGLLS